MRGAKKASKTIANRISSAAVQCCTHTRCKRISPATIMKHQQKAHLVEIVLHKLQARHVKTNAVFPVLNRLKRVDKDEDW